MDNNEPSSNKVKRKHSLSIGVLFLLLILLATSVVIYIIFYQNKDININDFVKTSKKTIIQEYPEFEITKITYNPPKTEAQGSSIEESGLFVLSKTSNPKIKVGISYPNTNSSPFNGVTNLAGVYNTKYHRFDLSDKAKKGLDKIALQETNDTVTFNIAQINKKLNGSKEGADYITIQKDLETNKLRTVDNYYLVNSTQSPEKYKVYYLDDDEWILIKALQQPYPLY